MPLFHKVELLLSRRVQNRHAQRPAPWQTVAGSGNPGSDFQDLADGETRVVTVSVQA